MVACWGGTEKLLVFCADFRLCKCEFIRETEKRAVSRTANNNNTQQGKSSEFFRVKKRASNTRLPSTRVIKSFHKHFKGFFLRSSQPFGRRWTRHIKIALNQGFSYKNKRQREFAECDKKERMFNLILPVHAWSSKKHRPAFARLLCLFGRASSRSR